MIAYYFIIWSISLLWNIWMAIFSVSLLTHMRSAAAHRCCLILRSLTGGRGLKWLVWSVPGSEVKTICPPLFCPLLPPSLFLSFTLSSTLDHFQTLSPDPRGTSSDENSFYKLYCETSNGCSVFENESQSDSDTLMSIKIDSVQIFGEIVSTSLF